MSALPLMLLFLSAVALTFQSCKGKSKSNNLSAATDSLSDDALMDTVQRRTFLYFWEGAEPNSGLAPERYHVDGVYPENDANVVTSGGSGFGIGHPGLFAFGKHLSRNHNVVAQWKSIDSPRMQQRYMKKGRSRTPLNSERNPFIFEFNDSAAALVA